QPPPSSTFPYTTLFRSRLFQIRRARPTNPHLRHRGAALRIAPGFGAEPARREGHGTGVRRRLLLVQGPAPDLHLPKGGHLLPARDRKSTRLNSSHVAIS